MGKTNLLTRYVRDEFSEGQMPTIGINFLKHNFDHEGQKVSLHLWDTAGQEKHQALAKSYYKNTNGAILVYDLTNKESFLKLEYYVQELRSSSPEDVKIILLGNKKDLTLEREVSEEEGREWAQRQGFFFMEVSAKTSENVNKGFDELIETILKTMDEGKTKDLQKEQKKRQQSQVEILHQKDDPESKCSC